MTNTHSCFGPPMPSDVWMIIPCCCRRCPPWLPRPRDAHNAATNTEAVVLSHRELAVGHDHLRAASHSVLVAERHEHRRPLVAVAACVVERHRRIHRGLPINCANILLLNAGHPVVLGSQRVCQYDDLTEAQTHDEQRGSLGPSLRVEGLTAGGRGVVITAMSALILGPRAGSARSSG